MWGLLQMVSQVLLACLQRRAMMASAPLTVQCMPACLSLCPTDLQLASTTPEPAKRPHWLRGLAGVAAWHDEQKARIFPAQLQPILRGLAAQQVSSMLDKPEHHWRQCPNPPRTGNGWRAFNLGTYDRIETLAFGQGWDIEYPRDTRRLRKLGIDRPAATISFGQITQSWLKSLAKRWARWQLTTGRSSGTAARAAAALSRFSQFLATQPASIDGLAQVDRPLLEAYLAGLHTAVGGRKCHAQHLTALGGFLTAIRQHRWDEGALPASAMLFTEDYPRRAKGLPRALAGQVMAQRDRRDNLDRWDRPRLPAHHHDPDALRPAYLRRLQDPVRLPGHRRPAVPPRVSGGPW